MRKPGELAVGLAVAFAGVAAGYAVYSYWKPVNTGRVPTSSVVLASSALQPEPMEVLDPVGAPVRVANPFDSSEIFDLNFRPAPATRMHAMQLRAF